MPNGKFIWGKQMNTNVNSVYIKDGTQERMILEYIFKNGSITTLQAIKDLGILQSPARIWGLKRRGVNIKTRWTTVSDRFQRERRVVEYFIPEGEPVYLDNLEELAKK